MTFAILGGGQLDTGYTIDNSLRFNDDDSAVLSRTPGTAGDRKTYTISTWVKRSLLTSQIQPFLECYLNANQWTSVSFGTDDKIQFYHVDSGTDYGYQTDMVFRDIAAWYHIVIALDTTQATAANRMILYVNGNETTFDQNYGEFPQNDNTWINSTNAHNIGKYSDQSKYFDGYMAEYHFIDGQQLTASDFGEFDEDSGIWKPKAYEGTYGTNGFYLDFENSGSLGADQSGNGNNFTPTNLASTDQMPDTPTNNFATLNILDPSALTYSEGNLKTLNTTILNYNADPTFTDVFFDMYAEGYVVSVGGASFHHRLTLAIDGVSNIQYRADGEIFIGGTLATTVASYTTGDIISAYVSLDNDEAYFFKNNTLVYTYSAAGMTSIIRFTFRTARDNGSWIVNFGQDSSFAGTLTRQNNTDANGIGDFYYSTASNAYALCTKNIATESPPTIDDASQYFDTYLDTASSSNGTYNLGNLSFQPDFSWRKNRDNVESHFLFDSSRGYDETKMMSSNSTADEPAASANLVDTTVSARNGGMTVVEGSINNGEFYFNSRTYVTWNWLVNGGSTSSNTDGSITSTVQVNSTAGFSIVTYTGTGSNATVGHGLGVTPDCFVVKRRSASEGWTLYHKNTSSTPEGDHLLWNSDIATVDQADIWNDTAPTSSVFSVGINSATNASGSTYVAYCFAEIEGYSRFNSYTGNGSTDGAFVSTGFRPAFVIYKNSSSATDWRMFDNKRNSFNVINGRLFPNSTSTENTVQDTVDFLSNGFKLRTTNSGDNGSGNTFIYMAFAENPFVTSTGIPGCAR